MNCTRIFDSDSYSCIDGLNYDSEIITDLTESEQTSLKDIWKHACIPHCNTPLCQLGFCYYLADNSFKYNCTHCVLPAENHLIADMWHCVPCVINPLKKCCIINEM